MKAKNTVNSTQYTPIILSATFLNLHLRHRGPWVVHASDDQAPPSFAWYFTSECHYWYWHQV